MAEKTRLSTIAGRRFELRRATVERAMRGVLPDPLVDYFVVIRGRRYPPKQVIGRVTGLDRADFTTHQARRVLMGLGFPVGRRGGKPGPSASRGARASTSASEALRPFIGQWVAVRGDEVLVAADDPRRVVEWLARHGQRADSMFRVPQDQLAAGGLAPS